MHIKAAAILLHLMGNWIYTYTPYLTVSYQHARRKNPSSDSVISVLLSLLVKVDQGRQN